MKWTTPCPSLKRPPIDTNTKKLEIRISSLILNSENELNFIKKYTLKKLALKTDRNPSLSDNSQWFEILVFCLKTIEFL